MSTTERPWVTPDAGRLAAGAATAAEWGLGSFLAPLRHVGGDDAGKVAGAQVLVVDSNAASRHAMRALLTHAGAGVVAAATAAEALALLAGHEVALALLDVDSATLDGYALADAMRSNERTRRVPIVLLAAAGHRRRALPGHDAAALELLHRPIDEDLLLSKVRLFVELHRQRRTIADNADQLSRLAQVNALMLSCLANDVCEPLTVLALNTQILQQRSESPTLQKATARVKSATVQLHRQLEQLVTLARTQSVELRPQMPTPEATSRAP